MKLNNNDDSHNSGLNLLIYNMLLDIESHPTWVCGLKHWKKEIEYLQLVTPYVGVWIETQEGFRRPDNQGSHTLRGCVDWNNYNVIICCKHYCHTLRGCVDWNNGGVIIY